MFGLTFCFGFGVLCFVSCVTCFYIAAIEANMGKRNMLRGRKSREKPLTALGIAFGVLAIAAFADTTFIGGPAELWHHFSPAPHIEKIEIP